MIIGRRKRFSIRIFVLAFNLAFLFFVLSSFIKAPVQASFRITSPDSASNDDYGVIVKGYSGTWFGSPIYNDTELKLSWSETGPCMASGDWSGSKAASGVETLTVGPRATPKLFTYNLNCAGINKTVYGGYAIPEVRSSGDLDGIIAGFRNLGISGFTQVTSSPYSFRFSVSASQYINHACGNFNGKLGFEVFIDGSLVNFSEDGSGLFSKHFVEPVSESPNFPYTFVTEGLNLSTGNHTLEVRMGFSENKAGGLGAPFFVGFTRSEIMGQFSGSVNAVLQRDTDGASFWAGPTIGSDKLRATLTFNVPPPTNNLNVQSSGVNGVGISGSQSGSGGITPYTYPNTSNINTILTAPATAGGRNFNGWLGCDSTSFISRTCTVAVSGGGTKTVTVDYVIPPNNNLWVYSNPIGGVTMTGSQFGTGGTTATNFPRRYVVSQASNINTVLTAPLSVPSGGSTYSFSSWSGCDFTNAVARTCTVAVTGGVLKIVTANYVQDRPNLTVLSQTNPQVEWVFTPQKIVANIPMTITATIQNNGTANISSTSTFFNSLRVVSGGGFDPSPIPNTSWTSGLNAGLSQQFTWSGTPTSSNTYTFEVCADSTSLITESDESLADNCERASVEVDSAKAWLKTVGGNVGSATNQSGIDSISGWSPSGCSAANPNFCNSTHLIVAARGIQNTFKSAKNWLLPTYTGGPNLGTYRNYEAFYRDFSAGACDRSTDSSKLPNTKGKFIYKGPGTVSFTSYDINPCGAFVSSNKDAILIFIEGDLQISASMPALNLPTVFIVKGNISIAGGATNIGGMFVADGNFTTGSSDQQLRINGSVAAALNTSGVLTFDRDLGDDDNDDTPAELITFDPKYLYLLTDFLGSSVSNYREDNP